VNKFLHFNIQFTQDHRKLFKKRWQSRTVATEPPSADKIRNLATAFMNKKSFDDEVFAVLNIGVTFVSLKDRYNRKVGRIESEKRMKLEKIKVTGVLINNTHIYVNLETWKGISLNLRVNKESEYTTVTGELVGTNAATI
jgi:hypothetical protein